MLRLYRKLPHEVDQLTISEITLAMEEPRPRPFGGRGEMQTEEEYQRSAAYFQGLSEKEKLLYAAGRLNHGR